MRAAGVLRIVTRGNASDAMRITLILGAMTALSHSGTRTSRVAAIDVLRGLACVLMAIDHVRVYSGVPAGGEDVGVFLTRWVTHFVAPAFCFFAGVSAFLHGRQLERSSALARFLLTRGLLLVLPELTVIRFVWAFTVGTDFMLAGVIWMLGWCMVVLAALVRYRASIVGWIGVSIVLVQQLFGLVSRLDWFGSVAPVWNYLYPTGSDRVFGGIIVLYVIVPWIGVMMAGYGCGALFDREPVARDRLFTRVGVAMTMVWLVVGTAFALARGGEADGESEPFWMLLLNQRKYPASQLFLLMTIGPLIAMLPWAGRTTGRVGSILQCFGRVPMFYYLAHLLVIHVLSIIVMRVRFGVFDPVWYATAPFTRVPEAQRWSLWLLYGVWVVSLAILYVLCDWYAKRKREQPTWWMAYI
jgi:uncharacterized membrane protein